MHFAHQWFWCAVFTLQQLGAPHSVQGPRHGSSLCKRRLQAPPISQALAHRNCTCAGAYKDGLGRDAVAVYTFFTQHLSHMATAGRISKTGTMHVYMYIYIYIYKKYSFGFCPRICLSCDLESGRSHSAWISIMIVICAACRFSVMHMLMCAYTQSYIKSWLAVHRFRALHSWLSSRSSSSTAEWPLCGPLAGTLPRAAPRSLAALPTFRLACTCEKHNSSGYSRPPKQWGTFAFHASLGLAACLLCLGLSAKHSCPWTISFAFAFAFALALLLSLALASRLALVLGQVSFASRCSCSGRLLEKPIFAIFELLEQSFVVEIVILGRERLRWFCSFGWRQG